jgi:hypothetical protein
MLTPPVTPQTATSIPASSIQKHHRRFLLSGSRLQASDIERTVLFLDYLKARVAFCETARLLQAPPSSNIPAAPTSPTSPSSSALNPPSVTEPATHAPAEQSKTPRPHFLREQREARASRQPPAVPIDRVRPASTPPTSGKPKLIRAHNGDDTPTRFLADTGEVIFLNAPALRVRTVQTHSITRERIADASSTTTEPSRRGGSRSAPITLSSGVGSIFDKEIWSVEVAESPLLRLRPMQCRSDGCSNDRSSAKTSYCSHCSQLHYEPARANSYVSQMISKAQRETSTNPAKASLSEKGIERLRAAHQRFNEQRNELMLSAE